VRRARQEIAGADLVLWLIAPDAEPLLPTGIAATEVWTAGSKQDIGAPPVATDLALSVNTGAGLEELLARLTQFAAERTGSGEPALVSRERDLLALQTAAGAIRAAQAQLADAELAAEQLRIASQALERLLGRMDAESVLDHLFLRFCIGK
jgi:tRNA modification GTPase